MTPYDPEPQPPVFDDALARDPSAAPVPPSGPVPPHTTTSGTEAAQAAGVEIGEASPVDPDERTDLEGPDVLDEDDGTLTHPSLGAGVGLNLGMGTGAGSEEFDANESSA